MALVPDGLYIAWSAAGGFATLAVATGGRAIFTQWRANAASRRQAEDWTTITDAASAFCEGDEDGGGVVLRALSRPSSQRIAVEALANLARVDPRVAESLRGRTEMVEHIRTWVVRELAHSDPGRRCAGAEIVGALRLRACRGAVALATNDAEPEVRVAACRALAVVDPDHAVGVLLGLVERDGVWAADLLADIVSREDGAFSGSDAVVQRANEWAATPALLRLLSNGRIAGAERVMIGALDAENDDVRANAAEALRESGTPEAIRALAGLLGDSNELIRLTAVRAIGQSGDPRYSMDLAAMLGDDSRLVRFAAGAALASVPGGRALLLRASEGSEPKAVEAAHVSLWQAEQTDRADRAEQLEPVVMGDRAEPPTAAEATFDTNAAGVESAVGTPPTRGVASPGTENRILDLTNRVSPFSNPSFDALHGDSPFFVMPMPDFDESTPTGVAAPSSSSERKPRPPRSPKTAKSAAPKGRKAAKSTGTRPAAPKSAKGSPGAVSKIAKPVTPSRAAKPVTKVAAKKVPPSRTAPRTSAKQNAQQGAKPASKARNNKQVGAPVNSPTSARVQPAPVAPVATPTPRPASALPRLSRLHKAPPPVAHNDELVSPSR